MSSIMMVSFVLMSSALGETIIKSSYHLSRPDSHIMVKTTKSFLFESIQINHRHRLLQLLLLQQTTKHKAPMEIMYDIRERKVFYYNN